MALNVANLEPLCNFQTRTVSVYTVWLKVHQAITVYGPYTHLILAHTIYPCMSYLWHVWLPAAAWLALCNADPSTTPSVSLGGRKEHRRTSFRVGSGAAASDPRPFYFVHGNVVTPTSTSEPLAAVTMQVPTFSVPLCGTSPCTTSSTTSLSSSTFLHQRVSVQSTVPLQVPMSSVPLGTNLSTLFGTSLRLSVVNTLSKTQYLGSYNQSPLVSSLEIPHQFDLDLRPRVLTVYHSTSSLIRRWLHANPWFIIAMILLVTQLATLAYMATTDSNHRRPPSWGPEGERTYSFRAWTTDIMHWAMLTDLQPHQQAAAILMHLTGSAREITRSISGTEILNGGVFEGTFRDPVSYVIAGLRSRFGQLEEESTLAAMTEMLGFVRHRDESINQVLSRFELVRGRAREDGQFVMSVSGSALQLLRACHISSEQMMTLLQPLNNRLPTTEADFRALQDRMRRIGHVLEHSPNNIGQSLAGNHEARAGAYLQLPATNTTTYVGFQAGTSDHSQQWASWNPQGYESLPSTAAPGTWNPPASQIAAFHANQVGTAMSYPVAYDNGEEVLHTDSGFESGTDSDTSSDSGNEAIPMDDVRSLTAPQAAEHIFMAYRFAKRKWRRFTGKRVRKVRRTFKRSHYHFNRTGKGKGGGKGRRRFNPHRGKGSGTRSNIFLTQTDMLTYLKGKGKGTRHGSSGQGFGRNGNPKDKDGVTMKCHTCGSEDHLMNRCTHAKGHGKGGGPPSFHTAATAQQPTYQQQAATAAGYLTTESALLTSTSQTTSSYVPGPLDDLLNVTQPEQATESSFVVNPSDFVGHPPTVVYPPTVTYLPGDRSLWGNDPWAGQDPWAGRTLPRRYTPSDDGADRWANFNSAGAASSQTPAEPISAEQVPHDELNAATSVAASSQSGAPRADTSLLYGTPAVPLTAAQAAVEWQRIPADAQRADNLHAMTMTGEPIVYGPSPAAPGFPVNQQLTELQERTRLAALVALRQREAIAAAAQLPDAQQTHEAMSAEAFANQYSSVFGRERVVGRRHGELTRAMHGQSASARAIARVPAIFGGTPQPSTLDMPAPIVAPVVPPPDAATAETYGPRSGSITQEAALRFISDINFARMVQNGQMHVIDHSRGLRRDNITPARDQVRLAGTNNDDEDPASDSDMLPPPLVDSSDDEANGLPPNLFGNTGTPSRPISADDRARRREYRAATAAENSAMQMTYTGRELSCAICLMDFAHDEKVCRVQCGHSFHADCFHSYATRPHATATSSQATSISCPNCRGAPIIIAVWYYVGSARLTQYYDSMQGLQVPNLFVDARDHLSQLLPSPRPSPQPSMRSGTNTPVPMDGVGVTETASSQAGDTSPMMSMIPMPSSPSPVLVPSPHRASSPRQASRSRSASSNRSGSHFIIVPHTFEDYNDWIATRTGDGFPTVRQATMQPLQGTPTAPFLHTETRLSDGRPSILIDPGSVGNLGGDLWARTVTAKAMAKGRRPQQQARDRPLNVSGVGNGSQQCTHNVTLPVALKKIDGTHSGGTFNVPVVTNSELPGLLGLQAMRDRNAILDMNTLQLHFCGDGDYDLPTNLPPGTESYQCEIAPSGHMVIPCCNYDGVDREERGRLDIGPDLALLTHMAPESITAHPEIGSSGSGTRNTGQTRRSGMNRRRQSQPE